MAEISLKDISWDYLSEEGRAWLQALRDDIVTGETVKESAKRRVIYAAGMYVKEVRYRGAAVLLKTLAGSTACKEGRISRELAARGIPAPQVAGYGKTVSGGLIRRDVLLTLEVVGGRSLFDFFHHDFPVIPFTARRKFIHRFASFLRKLHDGGVLHADLHIGNILLVSQRGDYNFVLLDTDRLSLQAEKLSDRQRIRNLSAILSNLRFHLNRNYYVRFLGGYGIDFDEEGRAFLAALDQQAMAHMRKICGKKARRCLSSNSRFRKERREGFLVYRKNDRISARLVEALLPDPDVALEAGEILKAGRTVRAARITVEGRSYFLKRYNTKGTVYRLRNAFRRSRAVRTWLVTWGFHVRGIPVPEPIACLEERCWRLLGRTYVLSEFIRESTPLQKTWSSLGTGGRKNLLAHIGVLLGRMHRYGCLHRDLKWANILVSPTGSITLIDLDGSRIGSRFRQGRAERDLSRFLRDLADKRVPESTTKFFLACWQRWAMGSVASGNRRENRHGKVDSIAR